MNLQYISDSNGVPTGVIPLKDWNKLKEKYDNIETELNDILDWHKTELDKHLTNHHNNPAQILAFDACIDAIDKVL